MSLNYQKGKSHEDSSHQWTSMSDLFLGLSVIFLLLYVVGSLKYGTAGIQQFEQTQQMTKENELLKEKLRVYEKESQQYLENSASASEQKMYEELMSKLTLLQENAKDEKESLRQQASENEKKEMALNKYQQMVRAIVDANLVAKNRIKRRDNTIEEKEDIITQNEGKIQDLEDTVTEKRREIAKRDRKISDANRQLSARMSDLKEALSKNEISKKSYESQVAKLQRESANRVAELRKEKEMAEAQINEISGKLGNVSKELNQAKSTIDRQSQEKETLMQDLEKTKGQFANEKARLAGEFEAQRAADRKKFEGELNREKLSAAERGRREAAYREALAKKESELNNKIGALNAKMRETEGQLAKARENLNAKRRLADQIRKNFRASGVQADVDYETGEVLLSFGDHYFDTGRASLKPEMVRILEKAVPAYSQSLFEDPKIADKISSIEIIGFASPTYKNKYIDPLTLKPEDRAAVNFNMKLSQERANSIYDHIFDTNHMTFKHQKQLLPLVKVSGRSFHAESGRDVASGSAKGFCQKNDCAKAQRVIIKFTLKD